MSISKILFFFIYLLVGLFPWAVFNGMIDEIEPIKNIFIFFILLLLTIIFLLKSYQRKELKFVKTPFDLPIVIIVGVYILSSLLSINTQTSLWGLDSRFSGGLVSLLGLVGIYFLLVNIIENEIDVKRIVNTFIYSSALLSFIVFLKIIGILDPLFTSLTNSGILSANFSGGVNTFVGTFDQLVLLTLILIPLSFQLVVSVKSSIKLVCNFLSLLSLLVTFISISVLSFPLISSIGGGLILFIVLVFLFIKSKKFWLSGKLPLLVLIIGTIIITLLIFLLPGLKESLGLKSSFVRPPELNFTAAWYVSTKTWTELPIKGLIIGSGPETYIYAFNQFKPIGLANVEFSKSTTFVLDTMSNIGIVGLIAYGIFVFVLVRFLIKKLPRQAEDSNNSFTFGLVCSVLVYLSAGLFFNPNITVQFTFYLLLALLAKNYLFENKLQTEEYSLSLKYTRSKLTEERTVEILPIVSNILIFIIVIVGFSQIYSNFSSLIVFRKALEVEIEALKLINDKQGNISSINDKRKLIDLYKKAYDLALDANNIVTKDIFLKKQALYSSNLVIINQQKVNDSEDKVLNDNEINAYLIISKESIDRAVNLNRIDYKNYESAAGIFFEYYYQNLVTIGQNFKEGDEKIDIEKVNFYPETVDSITKTLQLNPTRIPAKLLLARVYLTIPGEEAIAKAREQLVDTYSLDKSNLTTINLLGNVLERTKDYTNAKQLYTTTKDNYVVKDSDVYKQLEDKIAEMDKMLKSK